MKIVEEGGRGTLKSGQNRMSELFSQAISGLYTKASLSLPDNQKAEKLAF